MKTLTALAILFLLAAPAHAQISPGARKAADIASWATVMAANVLGAKAAWDAPDRKRALVTYGIRKGVDAAAVMLIKGWVKEKRPCGDCDLHDPYGFPSGHTAQAFDTVNLRTGASGPRLAFSVSLGMATGAARGLAWKHSPKQVIAGAAIGLVTSSLIR